jgi:hypothetical protein
MAKPSPLYQLIETKLDGTLAEFIAAHRPDKNWRQIAAEITDQTGVVVSWETLRGWFADRLQVQVTVKEPASADAA